MAIRTLQSLLLLGAIGWALFPQWGAVAFFSAYLLLVGSLVLLARAARKKLGGHLDELAKALPPEAIDWAKQHPLFYVWPQAAREWGLTLKITSLLMLGLSLWFAIRGLVFVTPSVWLMILPAAAVFVVGITWGGRLDLEALLGEERWRPKKPLHDEVKKVLTLQSLAGKWTPGEPA